MAGKKPTITCKVCGGEHSGTICTKFSGVRVIDTSKPARAVRALLAKPLAEAAPIIDVIATEVTKPVTKPSRSVTKPAKGGRPKVHASATERKRASRAKAKGTISK